MEWHINSAKNYSTGPKFELNLRILLTNLYTEFQFKMSICNGDNERKLKINGIFFSPRGITLPKNNSTGPQFKLNLRILVTNLYTEFQFKMSICNGDNERKLKIRVVRRQRRSPGGNHHLIAAKVKVFLK